MKIWRIENNEGYGPFQGKWDTKNYAEVMDIVNYDLPCATADCLFDIKDGMICGCENLAQLNQWILKDGYKRLKEMGYKIITREVKSILAYGKYQVIAQP